MFYDCHFPKAQPFGGIREDLHYGLWPDLPFSFVGDVVTLPLATYIYCRNCRQMNEIAKNREPPSFPYDEEPLPEEIGRFPQEE